MNIVRELRLPLELGALVASDVWRGGNVRRGDGERVMTIPGLLVGDETTRVLRSWLARIGYAPLDSGVRANVLCSERTMRQLSARLERAAWLDGRRVHLVGQSRGGMLAHVLAVRHPEIVASVTTLGSPLRGTIDDFHPLLRRNLAWLSRLGDSRGGLIASSCWIGAPGQPTHDHDHDACCTDFWNDLSAPLPPGVTGTAVYSRSDGIVRSGACIAPGYQPVEVAGTHIGMAAHPQTYTAIAGTLTRARRELAPVLAEQSPRPLIERRLRRRAA